MCSMVVFSIVGGSGRGLGSGWVVPFSSGGYLRAFQRQRVSPRARRGFVREVSPYSSLLGRYPFGRGVWGRRSRFRTPLKFRYPAPRGNASEAPKSRLNCASPSARRRWRWAVRLRNGFSVGTGATRAARQHPSGTALATLLRKATLRVGGYAFGGALRAVHMPTKSGGWRFGCP